MQCVWGWLIKSVKELFGDIEFFTYTLDKDVTISEDKDT